MSTKDDSGVVFLCGAGLRGWIWDEVQSLLKVRTIAPEYPGRLEGGQTAGLSLQDYVEFISAQILDSKPERLLIVAHSIGGVIALEVASRLRERLLGFVALGASIPEAGGSFLSTLPPVVRTLNSLVMSVAGTRPPASVITRGLCNGLSQSSTRSVVDSFVPESIEIYRQNIKASIPDTRRIYIRLLRDKQMNLKLQDRMIQNFQPEKIVDLETGHLPMLADPRGLASILDDILRNETH